MSQYLVIHSDYSDYGIGSQKEIEDWVNKEIDEDEIESVLIFELVSTKAINFTIIKPKIKLEFKKN